MDNVKVNALMIRATDYGENDKILTLLTAEAGRITAGIKGVRKAGAKLKFAAQPFCFAEYILAERGGRYTVTQASECESFYELRCDVNKLYAASSVCEVAAALSYEGDDASAIFYAAIRSLSAMCNGDESMELIKFLVFVLVKSGYGIGLERCTECGASLVGKEKMRFDMNAGSFTCWECGDGYGTGGATYNALRAAEGRSHIASLVTDEAKKRALKLLKEYIVFKTDARCASLSEYIRLI